MSNGPKPAIVVDQEATDLAHADIGLVAALAIETSAFLDRCEKVKKYSASGLTFRGGKYDKVKIACVDGGMGFAKARAATNAMIETHTPRWVLSVGFSGALSPDVKTGDIVMANAIVDTHGQELFVDLKMASNLKAGLHVGKILTVDHIVRTVAEKQELGAKYSAIAVDLESLAVAQVCRDAKTRFMAIRVISDDLAADLPPEILSVVGATGAVRIGAALSAMWKRPASVTDMWKLREKALLAAKRLATFLDGVILQLDAAS
jgi:adenosylhomocysteine nucleosidase